MSGLEIVGALSAIAGLVQITGLVLFQARSYITGVIEAPKQIKAFIKELESLGKILAVLQNYVEENPQSKIGQIVEDPNGEISKCARDLAAILVKLQAPKRPKKKITSRLKWPLGDDEIAAVTSQIDSYRRKFGLILHLDSNVISKEIKTDVQEIRTDARTEAEKRESREKEMRRDEVLAWLYPEDFDTKHSEIIHKRQKNTGNWILERPEFTQWEQGLSVSHLLCGLGGPGTGKTFLSSVVIDRLEASQLEKNYGVAYIYFDYADQDQQKPTQVLASLVKQLSGQLPILPEEVEKLYNNLKPRQRRHPSLDELYHCLLTTSKLFDRVFLIFDALDECAHDTQRDLLPLFDRMTKAGIDIFLTSRPYPEDVQDFLCVADASKIEISAHDEDVREYIEGKIQESTRIKRLVEQQNWKEEIVSQLVDSAKGMFLLARFDIENLCKQTTAKEILVTMNRLKITAGEKRSLDPIYDKALKDVEEKGKSDARLAFKIFSWLVKARRTLTVDEIQTAVSVQPGRYELDSLDLPLAMTMVDVCAGLVMIDEHTNTIRLAHYTVQEYLRKKSMISENAELDLTIACVTYLSFDVFNDGPVHWQELLAARQKSYPLFEYAASQLESHIIGCEEGSTTEAVLEFVCRTGCRLSYLQAVRSYQKYFTQPILHDDSPLHICAMIGHYGAAQRLLGDGVEVSVSGREGRTPLHIAVSRGHESLVHLLLQNGADHSILDGDGKNALHIATSQGHETLVRLLLQNGAGHAAVDGSGRAPLHLAATEGHEKVASLLIGSGGDIESSDNTGLTPLYYAAQHKQEAMIRLFVENGATALVQNPTFRGATLQYMTHAFTGCTVLHELACDGDRRGVGLSVITLLIDKFPYLLSMRTSQGDTPLHLALKVLKTDEELCQLLIEKGTNNSDPDKDGNPILHLAAHKDSLVRALVEKGIDISSQNRVGRTALHVAAERGCKESVCLLVEYGADPTARDNEGRTALHEAASFFLDHNESALSIASFLLEMGADYSIQDTHGRTALHEASRAGNVKLVQLLLDKGADISALDHYGRTMLHMAASPREVPGLQFGLNVDEQSVMVKEGKEVVIALMIEKGVSPLAVDHYGRTALHEAVSKGYEGIVHLLLSQGADLSVLDNEGKTAIHYALKEGNKDVLQLLVGGAGGGSGLIESKDEECTLQQAAFEGNKWLVSYLLAAGADCSTRDSAGRTPLHFAVENVDRNEEVVRLLLDYGADLSVTDNSGWNALHLAVTKDENNSIVELLIEKGAELSVPDNTGKTALHLAINAGGLYGKTVVELLVDKGANLSIRDNAGQTALHLAAQIQNYGSIVRMLLEKGADPSTPDNTGKTALHFAAEDRLNLDRIKIMKLLLKSDIDVSTPDSTGKTALHIAAMGYDFSEASIRLLLEHGADLSTKDNEGQTALHMAVHPEALALLLEKGADVSALDNAGRTALHSTVVLLHKEEFGCLITRPYKSGVTQLLLDHGADVSARENKGQTALHLAAGVEEYPKKDARGELIKHPVKLLLEKDADASAVDDLGQTALHKTAIHTWCEASNQLEVAQVLLEADVDTTTVDSSGHTALEYAQSKGEGSQELVQMLLEHARKLEAQSGSVEWFVCLVQHWLR